MKRKTIAAALFCVAIGMYLSGGSQPAPNPFVPEPKPSRPFLTLLARVAKQLLWVALLAEPEPEQEVQMAHARCDDDGQPLLDHGYGW